MRFKLPQRGFRDVEDEDEEEEEQRRAAANAQDVQRQEQSFRSSVMMMIKNAPIKSPILSRKAREVLRKDLEARDIYGDSILSVAEIRDAPTTKQGSNAIKGVLDELAALQGVRSLEDYATVHVEDVLHRILSHRFRRPGPRMIAVILFLPLSLVLLCTVDKVQQPCPSDLQFNGIGYRRLSPGEFFPEAAAILVVNGEPFTAAGVCPEHWTMVQGIYFIAGTLSGIGYGDVVPLSLGLKAFMVIFIAGAAILFGDACSRIAVTSYFKTQNKAAEMLQKQGPISSPMRPIGMAASWAIVIYLALVVFGSVAMMSLENWSMRESLYWAVVTCVKLGYGDVVPVGEASQIFATVYLAVVFLAMASSFFGLARAHVLVMAVRRGSAELKKPRSLAEVANLASAESCAESGQVDSGDFLAAMLVALGKLRPGDAEPILRRFRQLDIDGSRRIESRELQVFRHQHITCRELLEGELQMRELEELVEERSIHRPLPSEVPLDHTLHTFLVKIQRKCCKSKCCKKRNRQESSSDLRQFSKDSVESSMGVKDAADRPPEEPFAEKAPQAPVTMDTRAAHASGAGESRPPDGDVLQEDHAAASKSAPAAGEPVYLLTDEELVGSEPEGVPPPLPDPTQEPLPPPDTQHDMTISTATESPQEMLAQSQEQPAVQVDTQQEMTTGIATDYDENGCPKATAASSAGYDPT
jgi:hypothetical protein